MFKPPPVSEEPEVDIYDWFFVTANNQSQVGGHVFASMREGRLSSYIVSIEGNKVTTRSGKVYNLIGDSSNPKGDSSYLLYSYLSLHKITEYTLSDRNPLLGGNDAQ